jgi:hypothetical protein
MKFYKNNINPTHSNPLTLMRENYKYEVVDMVNNKVAFTNRMPRKDSNFFHYTFLIWNLKENVAVFPAKALEIWMANQRALLMTEQFDFHPNRKLISESSGQ